MTWFRVDDGFAQHPKVLGIPRKDRAAAVGLWLLAGVWVARNGRDGRVPGYLPTEFGCPPRLAGVLVEAGLWLADGDGWVFHEWAEYQWTREKLEAERAKTAERVSRWRARRRGDDEDDPPPGDGVTPPTGNGGGNGGGNAVATLPQSSPVQSSTTQVVLSGHQGDARGSEPTDDDLTSWTTIPPPRGVDLPTERRRFLEHNAGRWAEVRDPRRAWSGWLQQAVRRQTTADRPTPTPDRPECPIHPGQPTGSEQCPRCAAEAAPPPDLRAALRDRTSTSTDPDRTDREAS